MADQSMREGRESEDRSIVERLQTACNGLIAAYRFGSTVYGPPRPGSDTDIAVLTREPIPPAAWFALQEELSAAVGGEVDLFDLAFGTPVMAMQIITRGRLLYEGDARRRAIFEDHAFAAYARLNEERRGILERIAAEGSVYGR